MNLSCGNTKEKLTLKEAQLLKYFIINKNKILAREDILTEIWGEDDYFLGRSMDVFISRLRKYVSEDKNIDIRTVRGTGFILEEVKPGEEFKYRGRIDAYNLIRWLMRDLNSTNNTYFSKNFFYLIIQIISPQISANYYSIFIKQKVGRN